MRYVFAVLALGFAPLAQAQPESAYYGLQLGSFDYNDSDVFADDASSYRLLVGYQFMEHLAVEGGYGDSGKIRDSADFISTGGGITVDFTGEFKILIVRLMGVLPFDSGITLLGGLGYADMEFDQTYVVSGAQSGTTSFDDSGGEATYFAGVQYDWDRVALRLGYEKYDFSGDIDVKETSLTFFYKL
jgi:hypothetical protein